MQQRPSTSAGAAARTLIRASGPERIAMRLTGHTSRTIFDRDPSIHEQELLKAEDELVASLARQRTAFEFSLIGADLSSPLFS